MKVSIIAICLCIFYFTASSASPSPQRNDVTTESAFASTGGPIGSGGLSTTESAIVSSTPSGGGQNGSGGAGILLNQLLFHPQANFSINN